MSGLPPPVPGWRQYLPKPKVAAALVTVLAVAAVLALVELFAVDFLTPELVWGYVVGTGLAVGAGYAKSE